MAIIAMSLLSVFTHTLLPLLKTTASQPGSDVRIVVVRTFTLFDFLINLPQPAVSAPRSAPERTCTPRRRSSLEACTASTTITAHRAALGSAQNSCATVSAHECGEGVF